MQREVPFSVSGVGLVPDDFYEHAQAVIQTFPDEWDAVTISPRLTHDPAGHLVGYDGAGFYFVMGSKYVAFMVEHPNLLIGEQLRDSMIDKVRRAFRKAEGSLT